MDQEAESLVEVVMPNLVTRLRHVGPRRTTIVWMVIMEVDELDAVVEVEEVEEEGVEVGPREGAEERLEVLQND